MLVKFTVEASTELAFSSLPVASDCNRCVVSTHETEAVDWLLQSLNCVRNGNSIYEAWHDTTTKQSPSHSHSMSRTDSWCRLLRRLRCGALVDRNSLFSECSAQSVHTLVQSCHDQSLVRDHLSTFHNSRTTLV